MNVDIDIQVEVSFSTEDETPDGLSDEYRQFRAAVIHAYDGKCQLCQNFPYQSRYYVHPSDDPEGEGHIPDKAYELHHLISRSEGGEDRVDNVVPACLVCHKETDSYGRR